MIPIGDSIPHRRFPLITYTLIAANVAVFLYELSLGPDIQSLITTYGVTPATVWQSVAHLEVAPVAITFLTSMFIHGGWLHLLGNMLYLWIFGDNVEDAMGHGRFVLFYLLAGVIAMATHSFFLAQSKAPAIGASGAIAGVLGAYLVLYPRARVFILIPLIIFFPIISIPAVVVLGFWFFQQVINGAFAIAQPGQVALGVAWWAHIGGFVTGMALVRLFAQKRRRYATFGH